MGVALLTVVGYLVAEPFHPLFGGMIDGPANTRLTQVREVAPFFFAWLGGSIATAIDKNVQLMKEEEFEGKTWLTKLNDNYYPGDLKFDPLGLKPTDAKEFEAMTNKELNNGRLAMIAAMGMLVQEQVTHQTLF